jgi:microcystin-dependent protein
VGTVVAYAGSTEPSGWLFCFGQAVSRSTYAALFAALGTTYGAGDGSTTFGLPDLRGRVAAGKDDMGGTATNPRRLTNSGTGNPGVDGLSLGAVGGVDKHPLSEPQMPIHSHSTGLNRSTDATTTGSGFRVIGSGTTISVTSDTKGGGEAHPNVQPTIVLNYIIKT